MLLETVICNNRMFLLKYIAVALGEVVLLKRHHITLLQEFSIPLIAGVILAVIWANLAPESYHHLVHGSPFSEGGVSLHFLFNDIFMVFFFGIAAKEITESCLPGGALNPPRNAVNPLLATLGGVLGPILVYMVWTHVITGDETIGKGWGIPTATDIALAWLVARMVFGKGHPAVSFLLLLAVVDDGIGLAIIAVFYPDPSHPVQPAYILLVVAAMMLAWFMRRNGVKSFWAYMTVPGIASWAGLYTAHLHPALALVAIVPFMPSAKVDKGLFAEDGNEKDTLNRFEHAFKLPVDLGLFGFGLMNAGVAFSSVGNATWGVLLALMLGKTFGVFGFAMLAKTLGFPLPTGMNKKVLIVTGMVAALGLTVALFVAGVAFTDPGLQGAAKMGALGSVLIIPLAFGFGRWFRVKRITPIAKVILLRPKASPTITIGIGISVRDESDLIRINPRDSK